MTLVDEIVAAFEILGGIARYSELYAYLQKNSKSPVYKHSIRARVEEHSSDSKAFKGGRDLFYSVQGLGEGIWGLRSYLNESLAVDINAPNSQKPIREGNGQPRRDKIETTRIIRNTQMSRELKNLYHYCCQVCESAIHLRDKFYAEAHHLRPLGKPHNGTDLAENIVVVCPNHHAEFDYGAIAINPKDMTVLHVDAKNSFIGKVINFNDLHKIDEENLEYHLKKVFGKI